MKASSSRGTFSQAELAGERVITAAAAAARPLSTMTS